MRKYLWIPCVALATLFACGGGDADEADAGETKADNAVAAASTGPDGARIYKTRCVACHGSKGNMGANGAANLQQSELALMERVQVITHGRKTMNAFKAILEPAEIRAVAEYTLSLSNS